MTEDLMLLLLRRWYQMRLEAYAIPEGSELATTEEKLEIRKWIGIYGVSGVYHAMWDVILKGRKVPGYQPRLVHVGKILERDYQPVYHQREREGETMKIKLDPDAIMPTRAHTTDAGLDLYAREDQLVPARGSAIFDTGVHVELPPQTAGFLKSKSGLNINHDLTSDGTIDEGYTGSIRVKLYNHGDTDYQISRGDKISQLVIQKILRPDLMLVDSLEETDRGDNGFGSSGR